MESDHPSLSQRTEQVRLAQREFSFGGKLPFGSHQPLGLISGPCVVETQDCLFQVARELADLSQAFSIPVIFKSSYEKDNRGSEKNWVGPQIDEGLQLLKKIKDEFGLPLLTDVHRIEDVNKTAEWIDVLQVPAYLCQQTSLLLALGRTGRPINVKKGQFLAPESMAGALSKIRSTGNSSILLTERGSCFGYNRLIADIRSIPIMQSLGAPVAFDATHIVRLYGISSADPRGGEPMYVPHLTLAGVAAGADALFIEAHPDPIMAKCDAASQARLSDLRPLIQKALAVRSAIGNAEVVSCWGKEPESL